MQGNTIINRDTNFYQNRHPVHVLEKETVYMKIMEIKIMKNNMEIKITEISTHVKIKLLLLLLYYYYYSMKS